MQYLLKMNKIYFFVAVGFLFLTACDPAVPEPKNTTHEIGEVFGGGVVFHVWKDSTGIQHGLVVDKVDLSTGKEWSNIANVLVGTEAQNASDGLKNSKAITQQSGHTNSAASLCLNSTNSGQNDWFLPSIEELKLLWNNRVKVNESLSAISGASILPATANYWSSTEYVANNAWYLFYSIGKADYDEKSFLNYVRAIRKF